MSNNALHNHNCPPLMSDQRHATCYRPSCDVHMELFSNAGVKNSEQMKRYLQQNANKLRKQNLLDFHRRANCGSCRFYHVDPNGHDQYWKNYKNKL
jgi:hypothetical protein